MKKRILLFTASIILFSGLTMSYRQGPGHAVTSTNYTGGPGSSGTCGQAGCHGTGGPTFQIQLRRKSLGIGSQEVFKYFPDTTYIITMRGTPAMAGLDHFGFNLMALDSSNTSVNAGAFLSTHSLGAFSNAGPVDTIMTGQGTMSNPFRMIVEHRLTAIQKTGNLYEISIEWKAPPAGMGTVNFYGIMNAVNNDLVATAADKSSGGVSVSIGETSPANVASVTADTKVATYPNPFSDRLNIKMENVASGTYTINIIDLRGKVIATETANVNKNHETSVNTEKWAAGMYYVNFRNGNATQTMVVVKQ